MKTAAQALYDCLISPNVEDRNGEPANVVDVIDKAARGLHRIGSALEKFVEQQRRRTPAELLEDALDAEKPLGYRTK